MILSPSLRNFFCVLFTLVMPGALSAQNVGTAVLYSAGSVYLNGTELTNSAAVVPGDVIQTKDAGVGNLTSPGSTAQIESNSIVRYQAEGLSLDRGNISVASSKSLSVFARDFRIAPASGSWTEFYVTRTAGVITILARKSELTVTCGGSSVTVKQGQQISREDGPDCGLVARRRGAPPAATGPILTSPTAAWVALGAGGALACVGLCHSDDPFSPSKP